MCGFFKLFIGVVLVAAIGYGAYAYAPWSYMAHKWFGIPIVAITPENIDYLPRTVPDEPPLLPKKHPNKKFGKPSRPVKGDKPKPQPNTTKPRQGPGLSGIYTCDDVRKYVEIFGWEKMKAVAIERGYSPRQIVRAERCL